ncbi:MAG: sugar transferase [Dehalococcoidales bacterium]|nr:sugar transferase [Dehalococcoidales bacterium]
MKRLFDFTISLLGLVVISPVLIITALLVKITSGSPVFYKQARVGLNGRIFQLLKFRTMIVNADKTGSSVTTRHDPRITPLGKFLRRFKLDELPQLINVLKGDMSFVGPRPDVPGFADKLQGEDRIILTVRPGITGPATLKYRNEEALLASQADPDKYNAEVIYPDKVRLNREYVKNQSFLGDMKYLLMTVFGRPFHE